MSLSPQLLLGAAAVVAAFGVGYWAVSGTSPTNVDLGQGTAPDSRRLALSKSGSERTVQPLLERLGGWSRHLLPAGRARTLERKLEQGGASQWTLERILALKAVLAVLLGLFASTLLLPDVGAMSLSMIVLAVTVGWFGPDALLDRRIEDRKQAIRMETADTIDQLNVMVRAGLGIDSALARLVAHGRGPLTDEFARVMQDLRFGLNRHTALNNMAERIDIPELRGFVAALSQADQLGVPISDTLRAQAEELRDRRRKSAEEQAMKLPVKMLLPMVTCMLPVLFIVILGPAVINIFDELG